MNVPVNQKPDPDGEQPLQLSRLLPPGDEGSIEEIIEEWGLWSVLTPRRGAHT